MRRSIPGGIVAITAVIVGCQGVPAHHGMAGARVAQPQRAPLARGMESLDEIDLSDLRNHAPGSTAYGVAATSLGLSGGNATARSAEIVPVANLGDLNDPAHFAAGAHVATAGLEDGDIPSLHLYKGSPNELFLYYDGTKWFTLVDRDTQKRLEVHRLTYSGLSDAKDFPATARFDWFGEWPTKPQLVMSVRCGMAWCLIGTPSFVQMYDPHDPDAAGTRIPRYRRVRGWYDRTPLPDSTYAWIYPTARTQEADEDKDFNDEWLHMFTVRKSPYNDYWEDEPYVVKRKRGKLYFNRNWKSRPTLDPGEERNVRHIHDVGPMPAAARWGPLHARREVRGGSAKSGRLAEFLLPEAWVRCASGCCSSNISEQ